MVSQKCLVSARIFFLFLAKGEQPNKNQTKIMSNKVVMTLQNSKKYHKTAKKFNRFARHLRSVASWWVNELKF